MAYHKSCLRSLAILALLIIGPTFGKQYEAKAASLACYDMFGSQSTQEVLGSVSDRAKVPLAQKITLAMWGDPSTAPKFTEAEKRFLQRLVTSLEPAKQRELVDANGKFRFSENEAWEELSALILRPSTKFIQKLTSLETSNEIIAHLASIGWAMERSPVARDASGFALPFDSVTLNSGSSFRVTLENNRQVPIAERLRLSLFLSSLASSRESQGDRVSGSSRFRNPSLFIAEAAIPAYIASRSTPGDIVEALEQFLPQFGSVKKTFWHNEQQDGVSSYIVIVGETNLMISIVTPNAFSFNYQPTVADRMMLFEALQARTGRVTIKRPN